MEEKKLFIRATELVGQMTLEEKAGLCSGEDCWHTKAIPRLGLKSIAMMDGPHGLRKQVGATDNLGIGESVPAVCFPTASALACSFDKELVSQVGEAIGEECVAEEVSIVLGPGANHKRSPLCGRNFEYFSEDPVHSGTLAGAMIQGIQKTGTGASLKHFAVNNQEKRRMSVDALVDQRTLRETYLRAFEIAVKIGKPDTVMCAYNKVNGTYCSENTGLLTDILRTEWGFDGLVVSDWGAVHNRVEGLIAGLDLEMPGNQGYNDKKIVKAVKDQELPVSVLDQAAIRITRMILKYQDGPAKPQAYNSDAHHKLAVKAAEESMVLLKNKNHILPGNTQQTAAVIGAFWKTPRIQGAGSSKINPVQVDNPLDALITKGLEIEYSPGYSLDQNESKEKISQNIANACETAKGKDIVYIFAGLPEGFESEGFDRKNLQLPLAHNQLIEEVTKVNSHVVVILIGGAPMELPWISKVQAVLLTYLAGEGMGAALASVLLGEKSPCGKLAETWPKRLEDTPCYHYFPGGRVATEYREGIFTGYKFYEKIDLPVLFPYGHGLSYTEFSYESIVSGKNSYQYGETITLEVVIKNTGKYKAKETILVFAGSMENKPDEPVKSLVDFEKIELEPMETRQVIFELDSEKIGYYNTQLGKFHLRTGKYIMTVASSSQSANLQTIITLNHPVQLTGEEGHFCKKNITREEFSKIYHKPLGDNNARALRPFTPENTLEDAEYTVIGKIIIKYTRHVAKKVTKTEPEQAGMMEAMIREMPFFAMAASGDGLLSENMMYGILDLLNKHYIKGLFKMIKP